jgi:hypothetical protein
LKTLTSEFIYLIFDVRRREAKKARENSIVMESIYAFVQKVIQGITILVVISSVTPPFLMAVGPIILLYIWIAQLYLKTSRELKRLDAVSRSPIYAQFSETLAYVYIVFDNNI